jgi:outer membrane cobalamin receptor
MKKTKLLLFLLLSFFSVSQAQNFTLSGYIQDSQTGEKLIGANIYNAASLKGTTSNSYGFFSLTLAPGEYDFVFSYVGYSPHKKRINLVKNIQLRVDLVASIELEEVQVRGKLLEQAVESSQMSTINLSVKSIKEIPALFGEVDVIKAIQLLPGVQSGTEGASGLYVRGGGPDQNLILLDGTPVYNASHLFGFFSVFNVDAINNVKLIKGGFPARYGGRLSSVLDISLKEGNSKEFQGTGSIGLISSKLTLEGPIIKEKTSFIVSARRTYLDFLIQPLLRASSGDDELTTQGYFFYDLNAKVNHKISEKDHLYLSAYTGEDRFYRTQDPYTYLYDGDLFTEQSSNSLGWGNITSALRWNHQYNPKLFSNAMLTYSNYNFGVKSSMETFVESGGVTTNELNSLNFMSGITDFAGKMDFDYVPQPNHFVRFGANYINHTFKPGASVFKMVNKDVGAIDTTMGGQNINAHEYSLYVEDDYEINTRIKTNIGLHYSGFLVNKKLYQSIQPRLSARYLLNETWSIKASYAKMEQYIHLLTNNNIGLPTDLWVPATENILPQKSHQVALGFTKTFSEMYRLSIEGYYKTMDNLIEYKDGASFMGMNTGWEDKVEMGKGWSYGGELFFEKRLGKLTGFIGYTLSWTDRQFENINGGKVFPYKYDRRHDVAVVLSGPLNDNWDFAVSWVYGTGTAHTLATERYLGQFTGSWDSGLMDWRPMVSSFDSNLISFNNELEHLDGRNSIRAADYHRLDISVNKTNKTKWGESTWTIGVYNAYNRKNPFYYYIGSDNRGNRALRRVSLFPFIPSITWSCKF